MTQQTDSDADQSAYGTVPNGPETFWGRERFGVECTQTNGSATDFSVQTYVKLYHSGHRQRSLHVTPWRRHAAMW